MRQFYKLYEVLGFEDAQTNMSIGQAEIKTQYRRMAKKWHPDLNENSPESHEMMGQLSAAYEVLGDPAKRAAYDSNGTGEEGLAASHIEIVAMEMLTDIIEAILYEAPAKQGGIMGALMGAMGPPKVKDWSKADLMKEVRTFLDKATKEAEGKVKGAVREMDRLTATLAKLHWKPNHDAPDTPGHKQAKSFNPVGGIIKRHIMIKERFIEEGNQVIQDLAYCKEMAEHYTFDFDKEPVPQTGGYFSGGQVSGRTGTVFIDDHEYIMPRGFGDTPDGWIEDYTDPPAPEQPMTASEKFRKDYQRQFGGGNDHHKRGRDGKGRGR